MSVCGTGRITLPPGFSGLRKRHPARHTAHSTNRSGCRLPKRPPTFNVACGSRNINRVSIAYATWPRLRPRLTLGGRTWPKKPEASGVADSHCHFRYSSRHSHLSAVQWSLRSTFTQTDNAPLPRAASKRGYVTASVITLSPVNCRRRCTRPVSYYALFQGWLLLSQPPGCLGTPTSLPT